MAPFARSVLMFAVALSSAPAQAGDYRLIVQRDMTACQDEYATDRAPPQEVADDLLNAFQDREPRIKFLRAMVMNSRVRFCSRADRLEFERVIPDARPGPSW